MEHNYPTMLPQLSTCKSPQGMFGALLKSYYAQKNHIDPKDLYVVSVIPCTAKKFEVTRPELANQGIPDVDVAITTRELSRDDQGRRNRVQRSQGRKSLTIPSESLPVQVRSSALPAAYGGGTSYRCQHPRRHQ